VITVANGSTITGLILSENEGKAIEKLEEIQAALNSTLTGVSNDTRHFIGEADTQQKIQNLKEVLGKWQ
jgi:hypothetical protein